jgi:hypothetical protein
MMTCFPLRAVCVFSLALLVAGCNKADVNAQSKINQAIARDDAQAIARINISNEQLIPLSSDFRGLTCVILDF